MEGSGLGGSMPMTEPKGGGRKGKPVINHLVLYDKKTMFNRISKPRVSHSTKGDGTTRFFRELFFFLFFQLFNLWLALLRSPMPRKKKRAKEI